ncbi:hypothetical protein [Dysgonomonas sp. ZJ709]|uniref:hypothetical protein n=1 Tax=Dysgonomonas sp. ZJ709 TaxID=2709797 RepID=UPI0013EBA4A3|nr:hypothetical protein [Dysgonomonas sp. ZJ709]
MIDTNTLNKCLIHSLQEGKTPLGLANGKMGMCIYFYSLSRIDQDAKFGKIAESLLDEIFEQINTINSIDVKDGLAGIGLGVDYLLKHKFTKGNIDIILGDIDDIIFKQLSYSKYSDKIGSLTLIHLLYYLCIRYEKQIKSSENEYLFGELIIQTINNLYERIDAAFFEELLSYNVHYQLPQILYVLGRLYSLNFYNCRISHIIEELSYKVLSIFPALHANRLYLLWGMDNINKQINDNRWEKHIKMIRSNIDVNVILKQELRNKNIFFEDGVVSVYCILESLKKFFSKKELYTYKKDIYNKIEVSEIWDIIYTDPSYFDHYKGLYSGFCGSLLLIKSIKTNL